MPRADWNRILSLVAMSWMAPGKAPWLMASSMMSSSSDQLRSARLALCELAMGEKRERKKKKKVVMKSENDVCFIVDFVCCFLFVFIIHMLEKILNIHLLIF